MDWLYSNIKTPEDAQQIRWRIESAEQWDDWCKKVPALSFKPEWKVYIIPPFGGALARFRVEYNDNSVSVYFDPYNRLGLFWDENEHHAPYFEIYPYEDDIRRYGIDDTDRMMQDIDKVLNGQDKQENIN